MYHPQGTWNRKLGKVDRPSAFNTYLREREPLSSWQCDQFWQIAADVQIRAGSIVPEDKIANMIADCWNARHSRMMETEDLGLLGKIRVGHVKAILKQRGRDIRVGQMMQRQQPTGQHIQSPKMLRKQDVAGLNYNTSVPWLKRIGETIPNNKPARLDKLRRFFAGKPDDYKLQM